MWDKARQPVNPVRFHTGHSNRVNLDSDGFTLVEALIAMAITGVAMTAIYGVFVSSNRSYHTQDTVVEVQQNVRVGIDSMARDIRIAGFDPAGTADAGIEVATSSKIQFTADMNRANGIENTDSERTTYEFDSINNTLRQRFYEGTADETSWETLSENVSALSFIYLNADGNDLGDPVAAANLTNIRTVLISITCQGTDAQGQTFTRTLNTRVICMNLGL